MSSIYGISRDVKYIMHFPAIHGISFTSGLIVELPAALRSRRGFRPHGHRIGLGDDRRHRMPLSHVEGDDRGTTSNRRSRGFPTMLRPRGGLTVEGS